MDRGAHDGVAGLRGTGPSRLRHVDGGLGELRRIARRPTRCSAGSARPSRTSRSPRTRTASPSRHPRRRRSRAPTSLRKPDSVGLPMPTVDVAIASPTASHLGPNLTGEVLLRGPIIMPGYWNKPEATAETVIDGWLHTGDVGHLDDEGYPVHHRPGQGHAHPGRRERVLRRDREPPGRAPGDRGCSGHRRPPRRASAKRSRP